MIGTTFFVLTGIFGVTALSVTIIVLGSLHFASKYREEEERCPEIKAWHKIDDPEKRTTGVTRCTLRVDHQGPHHCKRTDDKSKDFWWESSR